jgi:chromosomal replication initiator protein
MSELMTALTAPGPEPADAIIARVAAKYKLTVREIRTKTRRAAISHPRQEAMFELRTKLGLSYPMIARLIGLKDHTTVIYGIKKHEERLSAHAEKAAA